MNKIKQFDFRIETINNLYNKCHNIKNYLTNEGNSALDRGPGREHYKLFIALSLQLKKGKILELGTHNGNSAVALSYGKTFGNDIELNTYDIIDILFEKPKQYFNKYNINYKLENLFDNNIREKNKTFILSHDIIFIDIDPHEGILERNMLDWLQKNNYKGLIIFDDIHLGLNHAANHYRATQHKMSDFWKSVNNEIKIDLTPIGHWSGTGLVSFNFKEYKILLD